MGGEALIHLTFLRDLKGIMSHPTLDMPTVKVFKSSL